MFSKPNLPRGVGCYAVWLLYAAKNSISSQRAQLLVTANAVCVWGERTLMVEAIRSSETPVPARATRRHIPEDGVLLHVCVGLVAVAELPQEVCTRERGSPGDVQRCSYRQSVYGRVRADQTVHGVTERACTSPQSVLSLLISHSPQTRIFSGSELEHGTWQRQHRNRSALSALDVLSQGASNGVTIE
jgi:hypothetical protein